MVLHLFRDFCKVSVGGRSEVGEVVKKLVVIVLVSLLDNYNLGGTGTSGTLAKGSASREVVVYLRGTCPSRRFGIIGSFRGRGGRKVFRSRGKLRFGMESLVCGGACRFKYHSRCLSAVLGGRSFFRGTGGIIRRGCNRGLMCGGGAVSVSVVCSSGGRVAASRVDRLMRRILGVISAPGIGCPTSQRFSAGIIGCCALPTLKILRYCVRGGRVKRARLFCFSSGSVGRSGVGRGVSGLCGSIRR